MEQRTASEVLKLAQDNGVEIIDVRFCDLPGLMQHFSVPVSQLTEETFEDGFGFDGSSRSGAACRGRSHLVKLLQSGRQ